MRASTLLLLAASLILSAASHADTFTTTITGGGNVFVFPNVGGPTNYTYYSRVYQIYAGPLAVTANGGSPILGSLYFYLDSNPAQPAVNVTIGYPGQPVSYALYGPDLIGGFYNSMGLFSFYSYPGTYNLADANGVPYTYVVTDNTLSAVPEPSTLSFLATGTIGLLFLTRRQRLRARQTA